MRIGTFESYKPDLPEDHPFYGFPQVRFLRDETGRDWYDLQKELPDEGFFYIGVDAQSHVVTASDDTSTLFPSAYELWRVEGTFPGADTILDKRFDPQTASFTDPMTPVPAVISDRQFFQGLALPPYGLITEEQALAAVKTGEIPPPLQNIVEQMPADLQFAANMLLSGATTFERSHALTAVIASRQEWSADQTDEFFRFCAAL
jgi:hypothetical protein